MTGIKMKYHSHYLIALLIFLFCLINMGWTDSRRSSHPKPPDMVLIPGGEFEMGQEEGWDNSPAHVVHIDSFYIDKYEVTNSQYYTFCRETNRKLPEFWGMEEFHSSEDFPNHPVIGVTWADASAYAEWVGKRLPTEAEWEYAARGGLTGFYFPNGNEIDSSEANFKSNGSVSVGSFTPNNYGLYDMSGNVTEWVADFYDRDYYENSDYNNPKGPVRGKFRVIRGGGWHSGKMCVRVTDRNALKTYWVDINVGFRCAKDMR